MTQHDHFCTRRGCGLAAVVAMFDGRARAPWFACEAHRASMHDAMAVGVGSSGGVSDVDLAPHLT